MPSFRLELEIGALRPGKAPHQVMDAALASLVDLHVDATDIAVSDARARILVRFTVPPSSEADEDAAALSAAGDARASVEHVATTGRHRVHRRRGGHWIPVG